MKVDGVTGDKEDWDTADEYVYENYNGWMKELNVSSPAERCISAPTVIGGKTIFSTFAPNDDPCGSGGNSYMHSLSYKSGIPYKNIVIQSEGAYDESSNEVKGKASIGKGVPAPGQSIVTKQVGDTTKAYVQLSTGEIQQIDLDTDAPPYKSLFWIEK